VAFGSIGASLDGERGMVGTSIGTSAVISGSRCTFAAATCAFGFAGSADSGIIVGGPGRFEG
jgi:hypothetical protein